MGGRKNRLATKEKLKIGIILLSIVAFIINYKVNQDTIYLDTNINELYASPLLWRDNSFEEMFFSDHTMPLCIKIRTITWNYEHAEDEYLTITLKKTATEEILASTSLSVRQLPDNNLTDYIYFDNVELEKNEWYSIVFQSNIPNEENGIGFMCTQKSDKEAYAVINGERQNYNFAMVVYE